jgi:hypothetical protein
MQRAGVVGKCLVGPYILSCRHTGDHCQDLLLRGLNDLQEDVLLAAREFIYFMHDGAPTHFSHFVGDNLNITFYNRRIGREGPPVCPLC